MEEEKRIKRVKLTELVPAHLVKPGDCFKKTIPYLGTIIAKVRFKLKHSGLAKGEYQLPIEILHSTREEDGFYYKGQKTNLRIRPLNGKFVKLQLVKIKYYKNK